VSNYKIVSPYDTYLLSFKEILDAVFIGFLVYSLISLLLGVVTVSVLIILELDSRKKHIGTLMLLGWSSNQIRIWVVSNSIIKTILTILITSAMIQISINTLNVVIKEVSTILIVFNYPPIKIMLILIISLLLIIGNISLFHVNFLLKNPPKKLISET
jgi:ABC-type antimicrobial peptide transport system permease subunit